MESNDQNSIKFSTVEVSDKIQTLKKSKRSAPKTCVKVSKGSKDSGDTAVGRSKKSSKSSQPIQTKPKARSKNSQTSDVTSNLVEVLDNEIETEVPERPRSRSGQCSSSQQAPSELSTTNRNLETDCSQHYDSHVHISPSCNIQKKSNSSSKAKKRKDIDACDGDILENHALPGYNNGLTRNAKVPKKHKDSSKNKKKIMNITEREEKFTNLLGRSDSPVLEDASPHTSNGNSKTKSTKIAKNNQPTKNKKQSEDYRKRTKNLEIENIKKKRLDDSETTESNSSPTSKKQTITSPTRAAKYETVKAGHICKNKNVSSSPKRKNTTSRKSKPGDLKNTKKKISPGGKQKTRAKNIKDVRKRNKTTQKKKKIKGVTKSKTTGKRKNGIHKRKK